MSPELAGRTAGRSDFDLLERFVTTHDAVAFAGLMERHGPRVLAVCRRVLRHHHDAEDAFQATFLILARKARHVRRPEALAGWLYRVAYHLAMKHRAAAEWRRCERLLSVPSPAPADERVASSDVDRVLDEELGRMPDHYRVPLLLCCVAGRSRDEAAAQLGWTAGTLKMQLERGRQQLRSRLARRGLAAAAVPRLAPSG